MKPEALALQPDETLTRAGSIDVVDKVLRGHRGDQMIYTPVSGRCTQANFVSHSQLWLVAKVAIRP
jgi:hypothetical protein